MSQFSFKPGVIPKTVFVKSTAEKWKKFPHAVFPEMVDFEFVKSFKVHEDDIFVTGFPRSGTTRLQEMVWLIANDFNFEKANEFDSDARCPYFEIPEFSFKWRKNPIANSHDDMPSPRTMKTHLPVQLLPEEVWRKHPRIIYISREVKDVAVSNFHLFTSTGSVECSIEEYFDLFMRDEVVFGPYRENQQNFVNLHNYDNIFYLSYEAMTADMDGTILNVVKFLGKTASIENRRRLKEHLKFDSMKKSAKTNNKETFKEISKESEAKVHQEVKFIRKGIIGGYKSEMSQEYIDRFDKWIGEKEALNQRFAYKEKEENVPDKRSSIGDLIKKFQN